MFFVYSSKIENYRKEKNHNKNKSIFRKKNKVTSRMYCSSINRGLQNKHGCELKIFYCYLPPQILVPSSSFTQSRASLNKTSLKNLFLNYKLDGKLGKCKSFKNNNFSFKQIFSSFCLISILSGPPCFITLIFNCIQSGLGSRGENINKNC